ncbi:GIY-YIG nuclease family protein [Haloferax prahovense]|uniref:GIY-YIG nuclease family protein n=1 Tax=Haloferax prahovense TaxID=381852 RepID=UPI0009FEC327|nr:GIY-YIG nuclease family protein [Haloferax prahovense]
MAIHQSQVEGIYRAAYHLNNNDSVYYVGISNEVSRRFEQHVKGAAWSGSKFPHLFHPTNGVIDITGADSKKAAKTLEEQRALELSKTDFSWAYFN